MPSFNSCTLIGHATRDAEMRYLPNGTPVASFAVAVNRHWTAEGGEKKEEVMFMECTAWNKLAEICGEYVKKGGLVLVDGYLKQETWDDKTTGAKRSAIKMVLNALQLCGGKPQEGSEGQAPAGKPVAPTRKPWPKKGGDPDILPGPNETPADDDIPF